ncbi:hypothetical protein EDB85DRAFT_1962607 [Lactarius pseudohatsudake]|nr:hypothetical protein EDB85DRAFT_1962607 [Lactarius pseudohatsudake]
MTRRFTPADESWVDDQGFGLASPPYSPEALGSERVLEASSLAPWSAGNADLHSSSADSFLYESSLVSVNLGRRVWGLRQPVYGHNDVVQGAVKLREKCTHVYRLEVSLLGRVEVTTSDRGMLSSVIDHNIVSSNVVLSFPPRGESSPTEEWLPFSVPFPSFVKGGTSPLPPSYSAWSPAFSAEIRYCVKVDVFRKGLRRHELRFFPVMYLPKTWPSHPVPRRYSAFDLPSGLSTYKTVTLYPVWPDNARPVAKAKAATPTVQLCFPSGVTYPSGHSIPLRLTLHSRDAPALARLLIRGVEVQLVRRMIAWTKCDPVVGGRDATISKGSLTETDTSQEGLAVAYFDLTLGEAGKEQSWGVTNILEMVYLIRVSIRRPEGAFNNFVPTYEHVSRVHVASEAWGTRERELHELGNVSSPAIGMANARIEQRPVSSVAW